MKAGKPSMTARFVANTRATFERPEVTTGDAEAELRLYRSLGSTLLRETPAFRRRMERRTRFFDRLTLGAIEEGIGQVVIVGAGYDGRPLRFATPGVVWFEVDHPDTQADKRERLARVGADTSAIRFVGLDLTRGGLGSALSAAGHDEDRPSLFVVEGLLTYLPREVARRVMQDLRGRAAPDSRLGVAVAVAPAAGSASASVRRGVRRRLLAMTGEPWLNVYSSPEVDEELSKSGWSVAVQGSAPLRYEGPTGVLVVGRPASLPSAA